MLLLQMKLIRQISDLNKAVYKENNLGFVPTMGSLHKGHVHLIKVSKKKCKKTIVSIFINPKQDLKILKRLKVDFVYLPSIKQIYKEKNLSKITIKKSQKILCAKFRRGHFEGVLDVLNRFVKLISPEIMFMGEKDHQQYFLARNFISKNYKTKVYLCKTIRNSNGVALSSRNKLINIADLKISGLIANKLTKLKNSLNKRNNLGNVSIIKTRELIQKTKISLITKFNIKIEYLECRNLINLSTNLNNKPFKLFVCYYLNNLRLIDNF